MNLDRDTFLTWAKEHGPIITGLLTPSHDFLPIDIMPLVEKMPKEGRVIFDYGALSVVDGAKQVPIYQVCYPFNNPVPDAVFKFVYGQELVVGIERFNRIFQDLHMPVQYRYRAAIYLTEYGI